MRPREALEHPQARIYAECWAQREGDVGVGGGVAAHRGLIGACWMRLLRGGLGLGYIDDETPQLGIALFPAFQHRGYGEPLMRAALEAARAYGYRRVSLTVHPQNPAASLYRRCGFVEIAERRTYRLMVNDLAASRG